MNHARLRVRTRPMAERRVALVAGPVALMQFSLNALAFLLAPRIMVGAWLASAGAAVRATMLSERHKVRRGRWGAA